MEYRFFFAQKRGITRRAGEWIIIFDATIKDYLKEIDDAPLLDQEQEQQLGKQVSEENDPWAREQLVKSNLRLVVNIAKKYSGHGMSLGDLIEEGNLGLIRAVDYFDPERGTRFSTYAAWWIKQSIKRAMLSNVQTISIPTYMVALINQWRRTHAELENKLGRKPELKEMAEVMDIPKKRAKAIKQVIKAISSAPDSSGDNNSDEQTIEDTLEDFDAVLPDASLEQSENKLKLTQLLEKIDPREAYILKAHYGITDGNKEMSLKEIGDKLNLTRERIRQLQKQALTKLYSYLEED